MTRLVTYTAALWTSSRLVPAPRRTGRAFSTTPGRPAGRGVSDTRAHRSRSSCSCSGTRSSSRPSTRSSRRGARGSRSARRAGSRRRATALDLMDEPVRFISTVQIGITVFGIALGAVGEPLLSGYFDSSSRAASRSCSRSSILTYLSVTLGELVPKAVALQKAERDRDRRSRPARRAAARRVPARLAAPGARRTRSLRALRRQARAGRR